jgi:hypothetical protein
MKINLTNILLGLLLILLGWQTFFNVTPKVEPQPIVVNIPEFKGTSGVQVVEKVVPYTVFVNSGEKIDVDSDWKRKYEKAKDSLEKQDLYLQSIQINTYEKSIVKNDSTEINLFATTRGSLLDYKVDYKFTPKPIEYTPKVISERPTLSMGISVEGGVPTVPTTNFLLKGSAYFENKKGNGFSLGYDTDKRAWLGIKKTFKIIK